MAVTLTVVFSLYLPVAAPVNVPASVGLVSNVNVYSATGGSPSRANLAIIEGCAVYCSKVSVSAGLFEIIAPVMALLQLTKT